MRYPDVKCGMCPHFSYFDEPIEGYDGWCTLLCRSSRKEQRLQNCPLTDHGREWVLKIARSILEEARSKMSQDWLALWAGRPVLKLLIVPIDIFSTLLWLAERGEGEITMH